MLSRRNIITTGLFGNALEWYDFILYANFAPVIAALFFQQRIRLPLYYLLLWYSLQDF